MSDKLICDDRLTDDELLLVTNEELLENYYNGDDDAFTTLLNRHYSSLVTYAYNCLPNRFPAREQDAEDCATESLIKVMGTKNRPSSRWDPLRGSALNWMRNIVRYKTIDLLRKQHRQPLLECDLLPDDQNLPLLELLVTDHRTGTADAAAEQEQQRILFGKLVGLLPDELKRIVSLKYQDELKHREIANLLGCSISTVSRRLQEAERQLVELAETTRIAG